MSVNRLDGTHVGTSATGGTTLSIHAVAGLQPNNFSLVWVAFSPASTTGDVVSILPSTPALNPNFSSRFIGKSKAAGTGGIELWLIWGFSANSGSAASNALTVTTTAYSTGTFAVGIQRFDAGGTQDSTIAASVNWATDTSSAVGSGNTITPPDSEGVVATFAGFASTATWSSNTDTPGGVDALTHDQVHSANSTSYRFGHRLRPRPVAHNRVLNLNSSVAWTHAMASVTPADIALTDTGLYKGRATKTLDAGAIA